MPTAVIVLVIGQFFTAILGLVYETRTEEDIFIQNFLLARFFGLIGWLFAGLRGLIDELGVTILAMMFLILSTAFQVGAFLRLKEKYQGVPRVVHIVYTTVSMLAMQVLALSTIPLAEQMKIMLIITAIPWVYPIYILFTEKDSSRLQKMVGGIYFLGIIPNAFLSTLNLLTGGSLDFLTTSTYYMTFSFLSVYVVMLIGSVGFLLLIKEKIDTDMVRMATYDALTGIYNRKVFFKKAQETLDVAITQNSEQPIAFLLIDLDDFKRINDKHGHYTGDIVLQNFVGHVLALLGDKGIFGRIGGEEFALFISTMEQADILAFAQLLCDTVASATIQEQITYSISTGIAIVPVTTTVSLEKLYQESDNLMYQAKANGKNCIAVNH